MPTETVVHTSPGTGRHPNFFNGRLLSGEDLRAEQEAGLLRRRRLGRAIGPGIVEGLAVDSPASRRLRVSPGLALNGDGDTLELGSTVTFEVSPPPAAPGRPIDFSPCHRPTEERTALGGGLYLLTVRPTSSFSEEVPRVGVESPERLPSGCGRRWEAEGLVFELIPFPAPIQEDLLRAARPAPAAAIDPHRLRNLLQYWGFGHYLRASGDFRSHSEGIDAFSNLGASRVPLAALHWDGSAIRLSEMWGVRRTPAPRAPLESWAGLVAETPIRRGQARSLAFGETMERIAADGSVAERFVARQHLRFLPPAGLVRLRMVVMRVDDEIERRVESRSGRGFTLESLFGDLQFTLRGIATREEARLAVAASWRADPIDLNGDPRIDVYLLEIEPRDLLGAREGDLARAIADLAAKALAGLGWQPGTPIERIQGQDQYLLQLLVTAATSTTFSDEDALQLITALQRVYPNSNLTRAAVRTAQQLAEEVGQGGQVDQLWALFVRRPRDLFTASVPVATAVAPYPGERHREFDSAPGGPSESTASSPSGAAGQPGIAGSVGEIFRAETVFEYQVRTPVGGISDSLVRRIRDLG